MASTAIEWSRDSRLNAVWLADQACRCQSDPRSAEFAEALGRFTHVDARQVALLTEYGALRDRMLAREKIARDPAAPLAGELIPVGDGPQLALARTLLGGGRGSTVPAFGRLRLVVEELAEEWGHLGKRLNRLRDEVAREAERVRLSAFLGQVETLLLPRDAAPMPAVSIVLVWTPRPLKAAATGTTIILPVTEAQLSSRASSSDLLATAAHEFGHLCAAALGRARRVRLTNRILAAGLPNSYHANLVDEALHTAIGNLVFRAKVYPRRALPLIAYGYESRSEYPYAIDQLARHLQAPVAAKIGKRQDAYAELVEEALAAQSAVIAPRPSHFSRAAFVYSEDRVALRLFARTFPALQRWEVTQAQELSRLVDANPQLPCWSLAVGENSGSDHEVRAIAHASATSDQVPALRFNLRARTAGDMRDLLCALHQAAELPSLQRPLVLRDRATQLRLRTLKEAG